MTPKTQLLQPSTLSLAVSQASERHTLLLFVGPLQKPTLDQEEQRSS